MPDDYLGAAAATGTDRNVSTQFISADLAEAEPVRVGAQHTQIAVEVSRTC